MVPLVGLEPTCLATLDFESSMYTDFITVAYGAHDRNWTCDLNITIVALYLLSYEGL